MLYTYVLTIVYVRHFKTKVERQCFIRCRLDRHILNQVRVFVFCVFVTRIVLSIIINIMVVRGSLLSCAFVVVVVIKSSSIG